MLKTYVYDWIWEKPLSMHNYKYLGIPIVIIWSAASREGKQMLVWNSLRFYSYLYSIYAPTVECIASWIARHFRQFFTGVVNTTSTPTGWGRVATKWQAKATSSLKTANWHPLVSFAPLIVSVGECLYACMCVCVCLRVCPPPGY